MRVICSYACYIIQVVVTGDFNDFSKEDLDVQGSMPTSHVAKLIQDPDGDGVDELTNVISLIPRCACTRRRRVRDDHLHILLRS